MRSRAACCKAGINNDCVRARCGRRMPWRGVRARRAAAPGAARRWPNRWNAHALNGRALQPKKPACSASCLEVVGGLHPGATPRPSAFKRGSNANPVARVQFPAPTHEPTLAHPSRCPNLRQSPGSEHPRPLLCCAPEAGRQPTDSPPPPKPTVAEGAGTAGEALRARGSAGRIGSRAKASRCGSGPAQARRARARGPRLRACGWTEPHRRRSRRAPQVGFVARTGADHDFRQARVEACASAPTPTPYCGRGATRAAGRRASPVTKSRTGAMHHCESDS
jgi:hypothetical protein